MVFIDGTALNVALPAIQAELNATGADLLWILNAFSVPLAALLLFGGGLSDWLGRKRVLVVGIVGFAVASLGCGLANGVDAVIAARVGQCIAGALTIPGALAMIATVFGAGRRGRAIGTWSAYTVIATAVGPVLGGALAGAGLWRWVFFINTPIAAVAVAALLLYSPRDPQVSQPVDVDWRGALFAGVGLGAFNYGLIQLPRGGSDRHAAALMLLVGALALVLFVVTQRYVKQPLLPMDIFKSRALTVASLISLMLYVAYYGFVFFLPLNLIQLQRYDPAAAGLAQLPMMLPVILLSPLAGSFTDRHGPRLLLTIGAVLAALGFWLLGMSGITTGERDFPRAFLPGLLLVGVALGMSAVPLSVTVIGALSSERLGLASGVNSTLSRFAAVLAIALLGPAALVAFGNSLATRTAPLGLAPDVQALLEQESLKLYEARVPANLEPQESLEVKRSIDLALADAFRLIAQLAAGLSCFAALLALCLLGKPAAGPVPTTGPPASR